MKLIDMTVSEYLDVLASDSPAPGGGSAAALCGAHFILHCIMSLLTSACHNYGYNKSKAIIKVTGGRRSRV